MRLQNAFHRLLSRFNGSRRPRRRINLTANPLEDRQLLSGAPTATMTQTATFPNLEVLPNVATQAFLYFSPTMGTLTEVDVVTSGSYTAAFSAENLARAGSTVTGTVNGNFAINLPTGAIPVSVPSATETFTAGAFDGALDDNGTSGKTFAPVTRSSTPQATVMTTPAELAAFSGNFRIPITVSGHATGTASSSSGDISDSFKTQTSATLTIIYHYTPNLPSLNPPSNPTASGQTTGSGTGSGTANSGGISFQTTTQATANTNAVTTLQTASVQTQQSKSHKSKKAPKVVKVTVHKHAQHKNGKPALKSGAHSGKHNA
jgi:hypothetical protein